MADIKWIQFDDFREIFIFSSWNILKLFRHPAFNCVDSMRVEKKGTNRNTEKWRQQIKCWNVKMGKCRKMKAFFSIMKNPKSRKHFIHLMQLRSEKWEIHGFIQLALQCVYSYIKRRFQQGRGMVGNSEKP